jgi:FtsZ-binding cell division protein ZapB
MVTIEQVELLESKVSKAIDYVKRLAADNEQLRGVSARLVSENDMLQGKLDGYQKRIAELEVVLQGFKKDQERIEQGIVSALERLNHFEDAVGETAVGDGTSSGTAADGEIERGEPVGAAPSEDQPSPASAVAPSVAAQLVAASAEIQAVSAFPGSALFEPRIEEAGNFADGTYGESASNLPESETADGSGLETSDEPFGEFSGETENDVDESDGLGEDGENSEDDKDEFLDALKDDRPSGLGQIAAAFHENAMSSSENLLEKPVDGLELDIF